jgi:uncharacterized protein
LLESRLVFFILYSLRKEYAIEELKSQANRQTRREKRPPRARVVAGRTYTVGVNVTSGLPDAMARVSAALEGAQFALVFGSFGTPSFGPESDLDVAVSFPRALSGMDLVSLAGRLETAAGRRVDVVDLRRADPIIAMQVLRNGRPILVTEPRALAEFQMYTPSRYFDWKITRRPIEEAMRVSAGR